MEEDKTTHQFKPNSRFEDAVALYNFDIELRDLMFKAVQRLEIALRTNIIQEFSLGHGSFWFFDTSLSDDEHKFIENMNSIDRELQRCKEDFIKEHRRNYDTFQACFVELWFYFCSDILLIIRKMLVF